MSEILDDYKGNFKINCKVDKNKQGHLTVKGARDVLNLLIEAGFGDFDLAIGYDSNYCYTSMDVEDIKIISNLYTKCVKFNEV